MPFPLYGGFRHHDSLLSQSEEYPITLYVCIIYVSVFEGMYGLPCADDEQPNYVKVSCACVAIRRVSHNTVCIKYVSMLEGMYVLPYSDDEQHNYGKVPCARLCSCTTSIMLSCTSKAKTCCTSKSVEASTRG